MVSTVQSANTSRTVAWMRASASGSMLAVACSQHITAEGTRKRNVGQRVAL